MHATGTTSRICLGTLMGLAIMTQGAAGAPAGPAKGPLRVHPENPRYFTDGTKIPDGSWKAIYLTGSHTWNNLQHNGVYPPVDYEEYLDFLEKHHHNFIRMWAWEQGGWDPWAAGHVIVEPVPYARVGAGNRGEPDARRPFGPRPPLRVEGVPPSDRGPAAPDTRGRDARATALDGKPRYDLTKFNEEYFARLRSRVAAAQQRGIYVSVMLFQGWSVEKKGQVGNPWQGHPFNKANNINGIDGDLNGDGQGPEIHTLKAPPAILELQKAYVRQVIDTVNDLDNVLYEIGNEMHVGSVPWQYRPWVWKSFTRGLNTAFMDLYGATRIGDKDVNTFGFVGDWVAQHDTVRKNMGYTRLLAERMNLATMAPHNDLASTQYCLAHPGHEYLIYLPDGGEVTVDVSAVQGTLAVEWFNPRSGAVARGENASGGANRSFLSPLAHDAVLYLKAQEGDR